MAGRHNRQKQDDNGRKSRSRRTIGLLVTSPAERYQAGIWPSIVAQAGEHDLNLICFAGGTLGSAGGSDAQRNAIYDLVGPENVDGLIITSGTVGSTVDLRRIREFCRRYRPLPMVSIALALPGIPSIIVDNRQGLRQLLIHLLETHGRRRPVFIRGPIGHQEADERYEAYRACLAEYGLSCPDETIAVGNFERWSGARAIGRLLAAGVEFDAVVGANDEMAAGALAELKAVGRRVPEDVAVVGFDDRDQAVACLPPLTTVRQPFTVLGRRAVEMLLALMAGEEVPEKLVLPTELVVRDSCGCLSLPAVEASIRPSGAHADHEPAAQRERCIAAAARLLVEQGAGNGREWAECLYDAFQQDLAGRDGSFPAAVEAWLLDLGISEADQAVGQHVISVLRRYMLAGPVKDQRRVEELCHQARILVGQRDLWLESRKGTRIKWRSLGLSQISRGLVSKTDLEETLAAVAEGLPRLGVDRCYISLYEGTAAPAKKSRLILAYEDRHRVDLPPEGLVFPSRQLLPEEFRFQESRVNLLIEPLFYYRSGQLGFALFAAGPWETTFFQLFCRQLSGVLKGLFLHQERQRAEEAMALRTRQLAAVNTEMEQFAAIVSSDLQAPLQTVTDCLRRLEQKYKGALDADADDFIAFAVDGADRMRQLIAGLLAYSRAGNGSTQFDRVETDRIAADALANLKVAVEESGAVVTVDPLPVVVADGIQLMQVFQNLIGNAIKFRGTKRPRIHVGAVAGNGEWIFTVSDNGIGIEREHMGRIFQVFQRLHTKDEYPGTGIGLAACKKIVERHGGRIWVESEPGKGSVFYFTIHRR